MTKIASRGSCLKNFLVRLVFYILKRQPFVTGKPFLFLWQQKWHKMFRSNLNDQFLRLYLFFGEFSSGAPSRQREPAKIKRVRVGEMLRRMFVSLFSFFLLLNYTCVCLGKYFHRAVLVQFWNVRHENKGLYLTLSQPGFFVLQNQGGGGHVNPVTLVTIHSSQVFLKACPKWVSIQVWFPWKPWLLVQNFQIIDW